MKTVSKKYLKEFVHACKKTASYGLIKCSSGNLSKKIDKDHMLITPTRIWLSDIKPSDIVIIRISDGCVINGAPRTYVRGTFQPAFALRASGEVRPAQNPPLRHLDEAEDILVHSSPDLHPGSSAQADKKKPSAETDLHLGIYRTRKDINTILHFQTSYATALSCSKNIRKDFFVIPEIPYYIGQVAVIPYKDPGSKQLAKEVAKAIKNHDMVVMKNHGEVTCGKSFDDVIQKAVFFELACKIIIKNGKSVQSIPLKGVKHLLNAGAEEKTGYI
ncbi:MAG: class II aldolase/adducin family protein [Candidatus Aureabacteria bacterium]|nr:class II aldolase/adducin family protein [Candidatus Auribacterota bacterium]